MNKFDFIENYLSGGIMKSGAILGAALGVSFMVTAAFGAEQTLLKSKKDKTSYAIGINIGTDLKMQAIEVNPDILMRGLKDTLSGKKALMSDEEIRETMAAFTKELNEKRAEAMKKLGEKNKQEGEKFLAENKKKAGVKTLPSGLQYKVIQEGTGNIPKATDTVTVNYRGTFVNGQEFDSSARHGQPATFPVTGVVPGWTEALQLMKEGAKWQLFLPANLAYGERGMGGVIGPNATLVFEVELLSIKADEKK